MTDVDPQVHPTAIVDPGAVVGAGSRLWHFVHVSEGAVLGRDVMLGQGCYVGPGVRIGDGCRIQNNVSVYAGVTLGDEVFVGPSAVFTNVRTPRAHVDRKAELGETRVGRRATIGANATIVCGTTLGEGAFVGAGAVVTRDVPPRVLVLGAPARAAGFMCDCGERLPEPPTCRRCGTAYRPRADGGLDRDGGAS